MRLGPAGRPAGLEGGAGRRQAGLEGGAGRPPGGRRRRRGSRWPAGRPPGGRDRRCHPGRWRPAEGAGERPAGPAPSAGRWLRARGQTGPCRAPSAPLGPLNAWPAIAGEVWGEVWGEVCTSAHRCRCLQTPSPQGMSADIEGDIDVDVCRLRRRRIRRRCLQPTSPGMSADNEKSDGCENTKLYTGLLISFYAENCITMQTSD